MNTTTFYSNIPFEKVRLADVAIGLRQIGSGPDLVFIHGFPTHGYTWRKLLPDLSKRFRCHILDLAGLGDSEWSKDTDFNSKAQAAYIIELLAQKRIEKYSLIAHDSGATIARIIAIERAEQVENLILFNTEMPNHRPPWIPLYQKIGLLPLVPSIIRKLLGNKYFIRSPLGFREFYSDKSMLDQAKNMKPYLAPIIESQYKTIGAFKYLKGIDWQVVDEFEKTHSRISANVLFIWGEDDKTFPIHLAKTMTAQFGSKQEFVTIKNASLLPQEEKPEEITAIILARL